jgi:hypothetical protein
MPPLNPRVLSAVKESIPAHPEERIVMIVLPDFHRKLETFLVILVQQVFLHQRTAKAFVKNAQQDFLAQVRVLLLVQIALKEHFLCEIVLAVHLVL